jgi:hypothetical protein
MLTDIPLNGKFQTFFHHLDGWIYASDINPMANTRFRVRKQRPIVEKVAKNDDGKSKQR